MNEDKWKKFFLQEEEKMDVGGSQFLANHEEIMSMIEAAKSKRKRREGRK